MHTRGAAPYPVTVCVTLGLPACLPVHALPSVQTGGGGVVELCMRACGLRLRKSGYAVGYAVGYAGLGSPRLQRPPSHLLLPLCIWSFTTHDAQRVSQTSVLRLKVCFVQLHGQTALLASDQGSVNSKDGGGAVLMDVDYFGVLKSVWQMCLVETCIFLMTFSYVTHPVPSLRARF